MASTTPLPKINFDDLNKSTAKEAIIELNKSKDAFEPMIQRALCLCSHIVLGDDISDAGKYKDAISFVSKLISLCKFSATNIRYDNHLRKLFYTYDGIDTWRTLRKSLWTGHWYDPHNAALREWFELPIEVSVSVETQPRPESPLVQPTTDIQDDNEVPSNQATQRSPLESENLETMDDSIFCEAATRLMECRQFFEPMVQRALGFSSHTILRGDVKDVKYGAAIRFVSQLNTLVKYGATNIRYDNELGKLFYTCGGVDNFRACGGPLWDGNWFDPRNTALRIWFGLPQNSRWRELPWDFTQQVSLSVNVYDQVPASATTSRRRQPTFFPTPSKYDPGNRMQAHESESDYLIDSSSSETKVWSSSNTEIPSSPEETKETQSNQISNGFEHERNDVDQMSKLNMNEINHLLREVITEEDNNIDHTSKLSINEINFLLADSRREAAIAKAMSKMKPCTQVKKGKKMSLEIIDPTYDPKTKFYDGSYWKTSPPASALPIPTFFYVEKVLKELKEEEKLKRVKEMKEVEDLKRWLFSASAEVDEDEWSLDESDGGVLV